jgi:hypothetical protein
MTGLPSRICNPHRGLLEVDFLIAAKSVIHPETVGEGGQETLNKQKNHGIEKRLRASDAMLAQDIQCARFWRGHRGFYENAQSYIMKCNIPI